MIKKTVWVLLSMFLIIGTQAWAGGPPMASEGVNHHAVDNPGFSGSPSSGTDGIDSTIYFEDFESGQGDWTFVDVTAAGVKWHIDDFNGYNSTNSWWCADTALMGYDNHWLQYLVSPVLNFTGVTNPILTYKMYYAVEAPGGEPPPYDGWDGCNVWMKVGATGTWQVITPTFPVYNCQNLYSFGFEWGMGPGIAGWGGSSGGWVDAEFDLSAAANRPNVQIRFAFCSDPAYCTIDNPSLYGFFVDDVSIDAGPTNLLSNNADGIATPSEFTFDVGGTSGDYWTLTTQSSHSPSHSMLCDIGGHYNLSDALVSPWIDIPPNLNVKFQFWLWCNMLDFDGDGDNYLEDYYHVEVTTDGVVWTEVFYDYGDVTRPGGALVGWDLYEPGDPFNGNVQMSLSEYGGQQVKLRWRVITDDNDDGGVGDGLYIDDVEVFVAGFDNDVSAQNLLVPMPTSVLFDTIHCSVELHNEGNLDQTMVPAFWRVNYGAGQPLSPWASIPVLGMVVKEFGWATPLPGNYFVDAYTQLGGDENLANDTSKAGLVVMTAANVLEFGYDNREYSYEPSVYYFNFETGEGAYVRYTPEDDGIDFNMNGQSLKALFMDTGTIRVHIYEPGTASTPGPEVTNFDFYVSVISPNWQTIDVSTVPYLQNTRTDFWVWYEVLNAAGTPHILGWNEIIHGEGHFFANFGSGIAPSDYDFFARAVFEPIVGLENERPTSQPAAFALYQNTPNPFNPATSITFSLEKPGMAKLTVFDLMGRTVGTLAEGSYSAGLHTVAFHAGDLASGIYVYRLEADGKSIEKKMLFLK